MDLLLKITPRDPIIARDSRPFGKGQGNRMRSLEWPMPSTVAGSLRTLLGNLSGGFTPEIVERLKKVSISGPLPLWENDIYLPGPSNSYAVQDGGIVRGYALRPLELASGEGCNLPEGLLPAVPEWSEEDMETGTFPSYWSKKQTIRWLSQSKDGEFQVPSWDEEGETYPEGFLGYPPKDERTHVEIDPVSGASMEGILFSTTGLDFTRTDAKESIQPSLGMLIRVATEDREFIEILEGLNAMNTLGGERRLAFWQHLPEADHWSCPEAIRNSLGKSSTRKIRMQMATPAIFSGGWKPGWIDSAELTGTIPGTELEVRLISAVIHRWLPLAGWSYEKGRRGPKPIRRLVPGGSVYFMEVISGNIASLSEMWLRPVSDLEQDKNDGYGLSLWGIWE